MNYWIEVSRKGRYVVSTSKTSIQSHEQIVDLYHKFCRTFPKQSGYHVSVWGNVEYRTDVTTEVRLAPRVTKKRS